MIVLNVILGILELAVLLCCTYFVLSRTKRTIYRAKRYYVIGFLVYTVFMIGIPALFRNDAVTTIGWMICISALGYLLFHRGKPELICDALYALLLEMTQIAVIMGVTAWIQQDLFRRGFTSVYEIANLMLFLKIVAVLVITVFWMILLKYRRIRIISKWQLFTILLLPAFSGVFLYSLITMGQIFIELYGIWMVVLNITLLILLNLYVVYLLSYMSKNNELRNELNLFQQQNDIRYRYYEELEQKYQDSRKVIHDMRNHLHAVEQLYEQGEKKAGDAYIKDMHQMLNTLGHQYYTSNRMLNMILNDKVQYAGRYRIGFSVQIGDVDLNGIKDVDITTIFANLLDNAIEELIGEAEQERKQELDQISVGNTKIELKVDYFHEFLVICVRNPILSKIPNKKEGHMGIGQSNVRETLKKYGGTMETTLCDGIYEVSITMPK